MFKRLRIRLERWLRRNVEQLRDDPLRVAAAGLPKDRRPLEITILGTCMADRLERAFTALGDRPSSLLYVSHPAAEVPALQWERNDAVVVLPNLRSLLGDDLGHLRLDATGFEVLAATARAALERVVDAIAAAASARVPVFVLAFVEPPSTASGLLLDGRHRSLHRLVRDLNDTMCERLEGLPSCHYLELNDLIRHFGDRDLSDGWVNHFTHGGFKGRLCDAFHTAVAVRLHNALAVLRAETPIKVIVTDLDNTLWNGVLAEFDEIVPHVHTEGRPLGYAEALLEFKRRGGLLAIASKNDHAETVDRFEKVWGGRLRIDDFCALEINWGPKSESIGRILATTNLLPQNVLFIDDNPREIAEVARVFPTLATMSGDETLWRARILFAPDTQVARISAESAARTELIAAKVERDRAAAGQSRADYLRDLGVCVRIRTVRGVRDVDYARAVELLNKTNQFNTTGRRWAEAETAGFLADGGVFVVLRASDRFGDNGLVAVAAVCAGVLEQMVLSCRVFGLGIETALFDRLVRAYGVGAALFVDTGRNKTCATFYPDHGSTEIDGRFVVGTPPPAPAWIRVETE